MSSTASGGGGGDGEGSTTTTTTTSSNNQIGYCHTCDRQVNIDPVSFECSQCHGGFVELFDIDQQREAAAAAAATGATASAADPNQPGHQARVIRVNNQNLGDVLPLFLQMLNPAMAGFNPQMRPVHGDMSHFGGGGGAGGGGSPQTTTTRFQVLLPTRASEAGHDQIDLYGVINNVINDLLDPRRVQGGGGGMGPSGGTFHFQTPPIRIINLHSDARDYAWGAGGLDAIITQLLNQLENTGPPPASQDQLINLPEVVINQDHVDTNAQCAICMEDFALNDRAKKLPCKHLFHEPCITEWLKLHGTCPVCRKNLNGEDTSQREYVSRPPLNQQNNNNNNNNSGNNNTATAGNEAAAASSSSGGAAGANNAASTTPGASGTRSGRGGGGGGNDEPPSSSSRARQDFYDPDFD